MTSDYTKAHREYQGASGMPTHYGSIGLTVNYKGFYVGASLYGSFGAKIYDPSSSSLMSDGAVPLTHDNSFVSQLQRWQKPGDITNVPKRIYGNTTRSSDISSRFLYNANYLRLKTLRVGYKIPVGLLSSLNIGLRGVNVYMVARNIWTYKFDPDLKWGPVTGNDGFIRMSAPVLESVSFGLNVQF